MMEAGIAKVIITPKRGLPLAGYFNLRPNVGTLDDLHVRCVLFRKGGTVCGLVSLDVCMVSVEFVEAVNKRLEAAGFRHGRGLIIAATHTHTAPYVTPLFGTEPDSDYIGGLVDKTVGAVLTAEQNLAPATLRFGNFNNNRLAFNRRYRMQGGGVMTNPGKGNPGIINPEGPVDRQIGVLVVEQDGHILAVVANIVNHTDTIGGDFVSADWPGHMERGIQAALGQDAMVMTLIGCSGNINHFDITSRNDQTSYAEACHIGDTYAKLIAARIKRLKLLDVDKLAVGGRDIDIPYRTLTAETCEAALSVLERRAGQSGGGDMTSEGLAAGEGQVASFFAQQALLYHAHCSGKKRTFRLVSLAFGDRFAVTSLPGEPFTEIGLAIKRGSPFNSTWPVSLAMGACGYVPLSECYAVGGYETLPVVGGAPREDTAERLMCETALSLQAVFNDACGVY